MVSVRFIFSFDSHFLLHHFEFEFVFLLLPISVACRIDPQPNAVRQPNRLFFAVSGKVAVRCKHGYEKKQDGNLTCQDDGNWDKAFPHCTGKIATERGIENVD